MNFFDQVKTWLGINSAPSPEASALRQLLESGRRAKLAEDYPAALDAFTRALQFAGSVPLSPQDKTALNIIKLHQADIYILQGNWHEAETLLNKIKSAALPNSSQYAYVLNGFGTLALAQGDAGAARTYYEQALKVAKGAKAIGAQGRAMGHLAQLYLNDGNASYTVHLLRESLPMLNTSGDIEPSSSFVGLLGEAQIASGQEREGEQLLQRAVRLADQMQYRLYQRRWRLVLGAYLARSSRYEEAANYLKQALDLFSNRPPDVEHVEALCQASETALNLGQTAEAVAYGQQAHALCINAQITGALPLAEGTLGMALRASSQNTEALLYLERAANTDERAAIKVAPAARINVLRSLAAAQADTQGEIDGAVATYRRAIALAQKLDARLEQAQAYRDLGLLYSTHKMLPQALQEWNAALTIYQDEHYTTQVVRLYCDIANARKTLGQGQRAMRDYEEALTLLNSINDLDTRGVVLSNAATAYADMGDIESADDFFAESIKIAHKLGDFRAEATRRGNHAWFLLITGRARRATGALEEALRISRPMKLHLHAAVQTDNLGLAHDELHEYEVALHYHTQALELIQPLANPHWENIIKTNKANTLMLIQQPDEALVLLQEALAYGRAHENTEITARALLGLGRVALQRTQIGEAGEMLYEAVSLARRTDIRFLLALALTAYSEQQAAAQQPERTQALWQEAQKLFSIIHNPRAKQQPAWLNNTSLETK